jgi:hypothetical protein
MKTKSLIVAAGLSVSVPSVMSLARAGWNIGPIAVTNLTSAPAGWSLLSNQWGGTRLILIPNGGHRAGEPQMGKQAAAAKSSALLPEPGVYKTTPYTCIVIVPGKNSDDCCMLRPAEHGSAMPVIKPDLRFIPLNSK